MCIAVRRVLVGAFLVISTLLAGAAQAEPLRARGGSHGQVFILSGLMGELLSPGLEALADKIRRRGIPVTLASHTTYSARAGEASTQWNAGNRGAIIIIGHSFGASAAVQMARELKEKSIPVRLVVSIAPTTDLEIPGNVTSVVNYYQSNAASKGKASHSAEFRGSISNVDLQNSTDVNHFNMVQRDRIHQETMSRVLSMVSAGKAQTKSVQSSAATGSSRHHGAN